jgi:hypothetical protein
VTFFMFAL